MGFVDRLVMFLAAPGYIIAEFAEDTLKLPGWVGGIAGLLAVVIWILVLLIAAYHLVTSAIMLFV